MTSSAHLSFDLQYPNGQRTYKIKAEFSALALRFSHLPHCTGATTKDIPMAKAAYYSEQSAQIFHIRYEPTQSFKNLVVYSKFLPSGGARAAARSCLSFLSRSALGLWGDDGDNVMDLIAGLINVL